MNPEQTKDGTKYSAMIRKGGFNLFNFLGSTIREGHFFRVLRLLIRTLWLGWSIPFGFILKKRPGFAEFGYRQMKSWGESLCKIASATLVVRGAEKLDPSKTYLLASNHLSPFDLMALSATIPVKNAYIANSEFTSFFVTNYWIKSLGGVMVDKKTRHGQILAFKAIRDSLAAGHSLILFPEAVMSKDGKLQGFKRGGLSSAVQAGVFIAPVFLRGTREITPPGALVVNSGLTVTVDYLDPIDTQQLSEEEKKNIDSIVWEKMKKAENDSEPIVHVPQNQP